jgi:hypothetical protein
MIWILNFILPGSGLVLLRREWLGVTVSLLFGVCGNLALAGWLIAPEAIPRWLTLLAASFLVVIWVTAQEMVRRRRIEIREQEAGIENLLGEVRGALEAGDLETARSTLLGGAALDSENVECHVLWARVCAMEGDTNAVRKAWRRVIRLDAQGRYRSEAAEILGESR